MPAALAGLRLPSRFFRESQAADFADTAKSAARNLTNEGDPQRKSH
jgi:hypothetical protein